MFFYNCFFITVVQQHQNLRVRRNSDLDELIQHWWAQIGLCLQLQTLLDTKRRGERENDDTVSQSELRLADWCEARRLSLITWSTCHQKAPEGCEWRWMEKRRGTGKTKGENQKSYMCSGGPNGQQQKHQLHKGHLSCTVHSQIYECDN